MGVQTIYGTDRRIEVKASAADELMALAEEVSPLAVDPGRTLVVLGTADETLDCRQVIIPGGDHRISNIGAVMPRIMDFILNEG